MKEITEVEPTLTKPSQTPLTMKLSTPLEAPLEQVEMAITTTEASVSVSEQGGEATKKKRVKSKAKRRTARMVMTLDGKLRLVDSADEEGSEKEISEAVAGDQEEQQRVENGGKETLTHVSEEGREETSRKKSKKERRRENVGEEGSEIRSEIRPPKKLKKITPIKESAKRNTKDEEFWKVFLEAEKGFDKSDMTAGLMKNLPRMFDVGEVERMPTDKLLESFSQNVYDLSVLGSSAFRRLSSYEQNVVPEKVEKIKLLEEQLLKNQNEVENMRKERAEFESLKKELEEVKEEVIKTKEKLVETSALYAEQRKKNEELKNQLVQKEQDLECEKGRIIDVGREAMLKAKEIWEAAFAGVNEQIPNEVASQSKKRVREASPAKSAGEPSVAGCTSREPTTPAVLGSSPQLPSGGASTVQDKAPGQTSVTPSDPKDGSAPRSSEVITQNPTRRSTRLSSREHDIQFSPEHELSKTKSCDNVGRVSLEEQYNLKMEKAKDNSERALHEKENNSYTTMERNAKGQWLSKSRMGRRDDS